MRRFPIALGVALSSTSTACADLVGLTDLPNLDGSVDMDGGSGDGQMGGEGSANEGGPDSHPCDNLECQIVNCDSSDGTTLTGTVVDATGTRPIYNAFVYVPNRPLDPIPAGPSCTACAAPASGKPIVSAVSGVDGTFKLTNVPAGANIPLVVQVGKWRRKITVPMVPQCASMSTSKVLLPAKQMGTDDNIPQIAIAVGTGDWVECFVQRALGIDVSEFGAPGSAARVHIYRGLNAPQLFAFTPGDAYAFWGNLAELKKYDVVFNACETTANDRTKAGMYPNAYTNMKAYLDAGGRVVGTHYHYNWFAPPTGPADFQMQAPWMPMGTPKTPPYEVDDSTPRGKAFSDWLQANGITAMQGQLNAVDTRYDVNGLNMGMKGHGTYTNSTQWLFHTANAAAYLSFNTPVGAMQQCGRVAFSDMHISGTGTASANFPASCSTVTGNATNEHAMEFLFFDLLGCVQDDTKAPITPPTQ